jgi:hypothetical protein
MKAGKPKCNASPIRKNIILTSCEGARIEAASADAPKENTNHNKCVDNKKGNKTADAVSLHRASISKIDDSAKLHIRIV